MKTSHDFASVTDYLNYYQENPQEVITYLEHLVRCPIDLSSSLEQVLNLLIVHDDSNKTFFHSILYVNELQAFTTLSSLDEIIAFIKRTIAVRVSDIRLYEELDRVNKSIGLFTRGYEFFIEDNQEGLVRLSNHILNQQDFNVKPASALITIREDLTKNPTKPQQTEQQVVVLNMVLSILQRIQENLLVWQRQIIVYEKLMATEVPIKYNLLMPLSAAEYANVPEVPRKLYQPIMDSHRQDLFILLMRSEAELQQWADGINALEEDRCEYCATEECQQCLDDLNHPEQSLLTYINNIDQKSKQTRVIATVDDILFRTLDSLVFHLKADPQHLLQLIAKVTSFESRLASMTMFDCPKHDIPSTTLVI